jgi:UDP-N-acetylmuramoyl-tripeptide--D-alanyl-D-alanine ligase
LFAIGELAREAAASFGAAGRPLPDIDAAKAALEPLLASGTTVLVKGSRVMGLDRLVRALEAEPKAS